jgi:glycosyl hydrolase family 20
MHYTVTVFKQYHIRQPLTAIMRLKALLPVSLLLPFITACNTVESPNATATIEDALFVPMHDIRELRQARAMLIPYPRHASWHEGSYRGEEITEVIKPQPFSNSPEAYSLQVRADGIHISANTQRGLVYAHTTLEQLWNEREQAYPQVQIEDYPAYSVRGVMHDVGRNFQSIDYLKQQLRQLARYKINTFHWHLSDNPGWRVEAIRYPQLNTSSNYRPGRDPGKFYSYAQIIELFEYARALNIQIIPELDMPGHSEYFKQTFGFGMGSLRGRRICRDLLREFFEQVPADLAPYIHIGSDEVFIPFPGNFIGSLEQVAREHDRQVIVWKPGLNPAPDTIVQVWSSAEFDPQRRNIDSTDFYTNAMDPLNSFQRVYFKQILGTASGDSEFALGGIIATWNDVNVDDQRHVLRNNPFYLTALTGAEVMWNGNPTGSRRYQTMMPPDGTLEHAVLAEFEQRLLYHRERHFNPEEFFYVPQMQAKWTVTEADGTIHPATGVTVILRRRHTGEGLFPDPEIGKTVTATRIIHSDSDRDAWLHVGLGAPYRSHRKWQGIPPQGQWDNFGGSVALNGQPVAPPQWREPGRFKHLQAAWHQPIQEEPWREEELYWLRQAVKVQLQKGANRFDITTRYGYAEHHWQVSLWTSQ